MTEEGENGTRIASQAIGVVQVDIFYISRLFYSDLLAG